MKKAGHGNPEPRVFEREVVRAQTPLETTREKHGTPVHVKRFDNKDTIVKIPVEDRK